MRPVLLDTGVIVSLLDRRERLHTACERALESEVRSFVTCEAVIVESCHILRKIPGAAERILENIARGIFQIPFQLSGTAPEIQRIFRRYRDQEIDLADACLIHLAGELRTGDIFTLDCDFEFYRWGSNRPFRLLIPLH